MEAAFFDLDKTVIAKASMVAFGGSFYREGLITRRSILRAGYNHLVYLHVGISEQKLARLQESVLALIRGWEQASVRRIVAEALEEVIQPIIFSEAMDLIAEHRDAGRRVFIVSASPEEIVAPLAAFLGVDRSISSQARVDRHGRYTGEMGRYAYGLHKVDIIRRIAEEEGIDLAGSFAYSDSASDLPMLEAVGHPVAVNPDRALLKTARERDWEVRWFVHPVRLRDRMPATGAAPMVACVLVAALGLSGATWWRLRAARRAPAPPPVQRISRLGASWPRRPREQ